MDDLELTLRGRELIGLYLLLTADDHAVEQSRSDPVLRLLRERLEDSLYASLSIEEMERIETIYHQSTTPEDAYFQNSDRDGTNRTSREHPKPPDGE
jgi:hypothetical protein